MYTHVMLICHMYDQKTTGSSYPSSYQSLAGDAEKLFLLLVEERACCEEYSIELDISECNIPIVTRRPNSLRKIARRVRGRSPTVRIKTKQARIAIFC